MADDLDNTGSPFGWDEECRIHLSNYPEPTYAQLYGLTREELRYNTANASTY